MDTNRTTRFTPNNSMDPPTAAIFYFYTKQVPISVELAKEIDEDESLSTFITTQDVDSPIVRRTLLHNPTLPVEQVPIFLVQLPGSPPELISVKDRHRVFSIVQEWKIEEGLTSKEKGKEKAV